MTELVLTHTSTLGLRRTPVTRSVLDRAWASVDVHSGTVRIKVGLRNGHVVHAMPEYEDAAEVSRVSGLPVAQVLSAAAAAAMTKGLVPGAPWPQGAAI